MTDTFANQDANMDCSFEIEPYKCKLYGKMRATIYEDGDKGPQDQIHIDNNWYVHVEWKIKGHLRRHLCGTFCLGVHLESIGKGEEYSLGPYEVEMDPCGDGYYSYKVPVKAGTISPGDCGKVYVVAVTLTSKDSCGKPGHITAFCKEGCVMFVEPPHGE